MLRVLLLLLATSPALAGEIQGRASVIDGDTLEIHGRRLRINGIDAPESRQSCGRADGTAYRCGQAAALALADRIGEAVVSCQTHSADRYHRSLATCYVDGEDLGRWMVRNGHALAYRKYSAIYVPDGDEAMRARLGLWQGRFLPPWQWRARRGDETPRHGRGA